MENKWKYMVSKQIQGASAISSAGKQAAIMSVQFINYPEILLLSTET